MYFSDKIMGLASKAENDVRESFKRIDEISLQNTAKILDAFAEHRVSANMFAGTTGYGYDDLGRETLEKVFASVFKAEATLVRPNFVNGTHAITAALFSAVRPGDILLSATGMPYDTLQTAIGISGDYPGTLKYYGVGFEMAELDKTGRPDMEAIRFAAQAVLGAAKMVLETGLHPAQLKDMVCSPGGTTIEAVRVLEQNGLRSSVIEAELACAHKAQGAAYVKKQTARCNLAHQAVCSFSICSFLPTLFSARFLRNNELQRASIQPSLSRFWPRL